RFLAYESVHIPFWAARFTGFAAWPCPLWPLLALRLCRRGCRVPGAGGVEREVGAFVGQLWSLAVATRGRVDCVLAVACAFQVVLRLRRPVFHGLMCDLLAPG